MHKFLANLLSLKQMPKSKVICFTGSEYPLLFFFYLLKKFKDITRKNVISSNNFAAIKPSLAMSFLGQEQLYWLGNICDMPEKEKNEVLNFTKKYSGPHTLLLFLNENEAANLNENCYIVKCENIDNLEYVETLSFLWPEQVRKRIIYFLQKMLNEKRVLSLDSASVLINYVTVVGNNYEIFFNEWLNKIITPQQSLFDLSKYFFAYESNKFFDLLDSINLDYSEQFWIAFWSEQLFRAANFIHLRQDGLLAQAKKISYKLPFSFIQYDWKKSTVQELVNAHEFLYLADFNLKNGCSNQVLDLFYTKFFQHEFKKKVNNVFK